MIVLVITFCLLQCLSFITFSVVSMCRLFTLFPAISKSLIPWTFPFLFIFLVICHMFRNSHRRTGCKCCLVFLFLNQFCQVACILLLYSSNFGFLKISWLRSQRKSAISSCFILMAIRIVLLLEVLHIFFYTNAYHIIYIVLRWYNQGHSPTWNP